MEKKYKRSESLAVVTTVVYATKVFWSVEVELTADKTSETPVECSVQR